MWVLKAATVSSRHRSIAETCIMENGRAGFSKSWQILSWPGLWSSGSSTSSFIGCKQGGIFIWNGTQEGVI